MEMTQTGFHGLLVIDKPAGITSRDAVDRALKWFPRGTRIGHTGTLDPLATGVLVFCVGAATRLAEYVQRMEKVYETGIVLGARSNTDDAEGVIEPVAGAAIPDREALDAAIIRFIGDIDQVPPAFSAAKVAGKRAYDVARRGADVELEPRRIRVHAIDVVTYQYPHLALRIRCGKGTYIRSLARDLGKALGCGGYVETLRRRRVGHFDVADAVDLNCSTESARSRLRPISEAVAELVRIRVDDLQVEALQRGQPIHHDLATGDEVAAIDAREELVAILHRKPGDTEWWPSKVMHGG
jgi:tRNA pseudouridine55 synthase